MPSWDKSKKDDDQGMAYANESSAPQKSIPNVAASGLGMFVRAMESRMPSLTDLCVDFSAFSPPPTAY